MAAPIRTGSLPLLLPALRSRRLLLPKQPVAKEIRRGLRTSAQMLPVSFRTGVAPARRPFSTDAAGSAVGGASSSAPNAGEAALVGARLARLASMQKDLQALDARGLGSVGKKELRALQQKWQLAAVLDPRRLDLAETFQAMREELAAEIAGLRSITATHSTASVGGGAATAAIAANAAAPAASAASVGGSGSSVLGRPAQLAAAVALAGGAAFALYRFTAAPTPPAAQKSPAPAVPSSEPSGPSAPSHGVGTAGATVKGEASKPTGPSSATPSAAVAAAQSGSSKDRAESAAAQAEVRPSSEGGVAVPQQLQQLQDWCRSDSGKHFLGVAALLAVAIAGVWLLLLRPGGGDGGIGSAGTSSSPAAGSGGTPGAGDAQAADSAAASAAGAPSLSAAASAAASARDREVVYENQPDAQQAWDMAASVRGIPGNVQQRVDRIESN
eukprot:TRINITY_DN48660_c0_g1_i1.p1 TRINITY_DN48660_c0_g1~~TRINITY_DN48660_c0_g1_i1.p1  ORF type:complete len:460 (-),score=103.83 TRINITY_DN48660_c0_g1_i1:48-1376(-)